MNPLQTAIPLLIAAGIPAIFLFVIYRLDLYASRSFRLVMACFVWGALGAFGLALFINTRVTPPLANWLQMNVAFLMVVGVAPVVEEIAKSLSLLVVSRRSEFTYFVDGAIYGFAAGIGFSIIENFFYLSQNPDQGLGLALVRSFSTCLMHGTAAGLVGVAVGRLRFERRSNRWLALGGGWVLAILLHAAFNYIAWTAPHGLGSVLIAIGIGLGGAGLTALFIFWGVREQRRWLLETLDRQVGVTAAESRMVQAYGDLDEILEPIIRQFPHQADLIEDFVLKQAQLGIKRKVQQRIDDPRLKEELATEIERLRAEMDRIRREVGVYAMAYVRAIFPEDQALPIWSRLEQLAAQRGPSDLRRWAQMLDADSAPASERSIFTRIQGS